MVLKQKHNSTCARGLAPLDHRVLVSLRPSCPQSSVGIAIPAMAWGHPPFWLLVPTFLCSPQGSDQIWVFQLDMQTLYILQINFATSPLCSFCCYLGPLCFLSTEANMSIPCPFAFARRMHHEASLDLSPARVSQASWDLCPCSGTWTLYTVIQWDRCLAALSYFKYL